MSEHDGDSDIVIPDQEDDEEDGRSEVERTPKISYVPYSTVPSYIYSQLAYF